MTSVSIGRDDLQMLTVYAFRYALGRRTYASSEVSDFIRQHWEELDDTSRRIIKRETADAIKYGNAGDDCDVAAWRRLLSETLEVL